jgi:hypothetical protein
MDKYIYNLCGIINARFPLNMHSRIADVCVCNNVVGVSHELIMLGDNQLKCHPYIVALIKFEVNPIEFLITIHVPNNFLFLLFCFFARLNV